MDDDDSENQEGEEMLHNTLGLDLLRLADLDITISPHSKSFIKDPKGCSKPLCGWVSARFSANP